MQEIIGQNEDIMFDLEQIKLWTQSEVKLSRAEKEHLDKIPLKKKREQKPAPVNRPPTVLRHCWLVGEVTDIINDNM